MVFLGELEPDTLEKGSEGLNILMLSPLSLRWGSKGNVCRCPEAVCGGSEVMTGVQEVSERFLCKGDEAHLICSRGCPFYLYTLICWVCG